MTHRVLIVEDDKAIRTILSLALTDNGFLCQVAGDGEEAFQALKESTFDLVLIDLMLPGKNGAEVAWKARQEGMNGPIIAVSAQLSLWNHDDLVDCGFTNFLEKPFTNDQLLHLINQTLELKT